tara:strand:- start:277 stop:429 length:153 start_codon:yes stop_codon:yes gene_type:complete
MLKLLTSIYLFLKPCALTYFVAIKSGVAFLAQISDKDVVGLLPFAFTILG